MIEQSDKEVVGIYGYGAIIKYGEPFEYMSFFDSIMNTEVLIIEYSDGTQTKIQLKND